MVYQRQLPLTFFIFIINQRYLWFFLVIFWRLQKNEDFWKDWVKIWQCSFIRGQVVHPTVFSCNFFCSYQNNSFQRIFMTNKINFNFKTKKSNISNIHIWQNSGTMKNLPDKELQKIFKKLLLKKAYIIFNKIIFFLTYSTFWLLN